MLQKNYQEFGRKFVSFHPKSFLAVPALVKSVKVICFLRFYNCVNFSKTRHGSFLEFMHFLLSTATDDVIVSQPFPLKNENKKIGFLQLLLQLSRLDFISVQILLTIFHDLEIKNFLVLPNFIVEFLVIIVISRQSLASSH